MKITHSLIAPLYPRAQRLYDVWSNYLSFSRRVENSNLKIAVIGAGPCGLPVCKALKEFGFEFECFEASDRIGGIWNIGPGGNAYRSLQTNTSINAMAYSDFAVDEHSQTHPNAAQMIEYFQAYASHFKLNEHIRFGSRVVDVQPNNDGNWLLKLESGDIAEYSNVIVATGKYTKPYLPETKGLKAFSGEVLHSAGYLDMETPIDLTDKQVLVVGLGSSAAEIACELANNKSRQANNAKVVLSARSGRWIIPKIVDGVPADAAAPAPADQLPWLFRVLPSGLGVWLMRRLIGKVFRRRFEWQQALLGVKLPTPSIAPWADRPTLSTDFVPSLAKGLIELKPGIESLEGSNAIFSDGSKAAVDVIIFATGYKVDTPFIEESILEGPAEDLRLYKRIAHPSHRGLFFVGYCPVLCSMWPLAEQQARWIARLLSGAFKLPSPQVQHDKAVRIDKELPVICGFYVNNLRKQAKGFDAS